MAGTIRIRTLLTLGVSWWTGDAVSYHATGCRIPDGPDEPNVETFETRSPVHQRGSVNVLGQLHILSFQRLVPVLLEVEHACRSISTNITAVASPYGWHSIRETIEEADGRM